MARELELFAPIQHKWTPVFAAAWRGHFEIVKYLIQEQQCQTDVKVKVSYYIFSLLKELVHILCI